MPGLRHLAALALLAGCSDGLPLDLGPAPRDLEVFDRPPLDSGAGDGPVDGGAGEDLRFSCSPGSFLRCQGQEALYCDARGQGSRAVDCGAPCLGPSDCGRCLAGSSRCELGLLTRCGPEGRPVVGVPCPTLGGAPQCEGAASCRECGAPLVCGDGANFASQRHSLYTCSDGKLTAPKACDFGCDAAVGRCRDLVPASQALRGLGNADRFSCLDGGNPNLPAIAIANSTVEIDTGAATFKVGGLVQGQIAWGLPFAPQGNTTTVRVAHLRKLTVGAGSSVTIRGPHALILLVDGDVDLAAAPATPTRVDLAGHRTVPGPGGNVARGAGAPGGGLQGGGGGGGGHGTAGAPGGNGNHIGGPTAAGGASYGAGPFLEGGGGGGPGGVQAPMFSQEIPGGGGGGALQITACGSITIGSDVFVNLSGGGGDGGGRAPLPGVPGLGGGGGGAGGTLILEGRTIQVTGVLVANGGGGGEGGTTMATGAPGADWEDKNPPQSPALGGSTVGGGGGGKGSAGALAPAPGGLGGPGFGGGGGGGAVGRIYLNVSPAAALPQTVFSSPPPSFGRACVTIGGGPPNPCVY